MTTILRSAAAEATQQAAPEEASGISGLAVFFPCFSARSVLDSHDENRPQKHVPPHWGDVFSLLVFVSENDIKTGLQWACFGP